MRVERVRLALVPLTLHRPLRTSAGTHEVREAILIEVTTDDGVVGWGENVAPAGSFYTGETAGNSMLAMIQDLVPRLASAPHLDPASMTSDWWGVRGWHMAKHALSSAVWDAQCRSRGVSLAEALGGSVRAVPVGVVVGISDTIDEVLDEVMRCVEEGYGRIKLKIAPGHDLEVVRAVRSSLPGEVDLHVDGNGAYTRDEVAHVAAVAAEGVLLVEQPFGRDDLQSHADLARRTDALVCLDESVGSVEDLRRAVDLGACSSCNVKPSRAGGFADALALLHACTESGLVAWVGGMLESGIGRAGALALASHPACTLTPDLSASGRYFAADLTEEFILEDGCLQVPEGPGIGREPLARVLADAGTRIETLFVR